MKFLESKKKSVKTEKDEINLDIVMRYISIIYLFLFKFLHILLLFITFFKAMASAVQHYTRQSQGG